MPKDDDMGKKIANLNRLEKILKDSKGNSKRYNKNNTNLLSYWRKSNFDLPANFIPWLKEKIDWQEDVALQIIKDLVEIFKELGVGKLFYKKYNQWEYNIPSDVLPFFLYFRGEYECIRSYLEFLYNIINAIPLHEIEKKQKFIIQKTIYKLLIHGPLFGFGNKEKVIMYRISKTLNINIDQGYILPDSMLNSLDEKIWFDLNTGIILLGKTKIRSLEDIDKELIDSGESDFAKKVGFSNFQFPKQDGKTKGIQTMTLGASAKSIYITGLRFLYASIQYTLLVDYDYHQKKKGGCITLYHNIKHLYFKDCLIYADEFLRKLGISPKKPELSDKYITYGGYILKYYFGDEITLTHDKIQKLGVGNKKIKGDYIEYTNQMFDEMRAKKEKGPIYIDLSTSL